MVLRLRLGPSNARGQGFIRGGGTRVLCASMAKKKKKHLRNELLI